MRAHAPVHLCPSPLPVYFLQQPQPRPVAVHEAGHAVAALALGVRVRVARVTQTSGYVQTATPLADVTIDQFATYVLAGHAAQAMLFPAYDLDGPARFDSDDVSQARLAIAVDWARLALSAVELRQLRQSEAVTREVERYRRRADALVRTHRGWIIRTASRLECWGRMTGDEIEGLR